MLQRIKELFSAWFRCDGCDWRTKDDLKAFNHVELSGHTMTRNSLWTEQTFRRVKPPAAAKLRVKHQCEQWQLLLSAQGGRYCGACGEDWDE